MNHTYTKLTLLFLLLSPISTFSQSAESYFTVLAQYGEIFNGGKKLSDFDRIFEPDSIILNDSSYLGLAHSSGKYVELTEKGNYSFSELENKLSEIILFRESELQILLDSEKAKINWGVHESVIRCGLCSGWVSFSKQFNHIQLYGDSIFLDWKYRDQKLINESEILFSDLLSEKSGKFTSTNQSLTTKWKSNWDNFPNSSININMKTIQQETEEKSTSRLDAVIRKTPKNRFPTIRQAVLLNQSDKSILSDLALAIAFEANEFPMDAYFVYQKLLTQNPKISSFKKLFSDFADRQLIFNSN
ncbi:MAG: hypothetical protein ACI81T_001717 [Bacteroidia bacterium]